MRLRHVAPLILLALCATSAQAGLFGLTRTSQLPTIDGVIGWHGGGEDLGIVLLDGTCKELKLTGRMARLKWPIGKRAKARIGTDGKIAQRSLHGRRNKFLVSNPCSYLATGTATSGADEGAFVAEVCDDLPEVCGASASGWRSRGAAWLRNRVVAAVARCRAGADCEGDRAELKILRGRVDDLNESLRICNAKPAPTTAGASSLEVTSTGRIKGFGWGCGQLGICVESVKDGHHDGCNDQTLEALCGGPAR